METLKLIYLAAGPGIAVAVYIYYSDRWEPNSKRHSCQSFSIGRFGLLSHSLCRDGFWKSFWSGRYFQWKS